MAYQLDEAMPPTLRDVSYKDAELPVRYCLLVVRQDETGFKQELRTNLSSVNAWKPCPSRSVAANISFAEAAIVHAQSTRGRP